LVLLATSLLACGPEDGGTPIDSAPSEEPTAPLAGAATPDGASDGWLATVQERIAAEGRAFHLREGAFMADLPTAGLSARLDAEGVEVSGEGGEVLRLRSSAWGRGGDLLSIGARAPALGDCTAALDASGTCVRRVELEEAGLTEWWVGLGTGLEQGWVVEAPPAGEGALVVVVDVEGATSIDADGEEATLFDGEGRMWIVGGVSAWDTEGEPLPTRLLATDAGLRVEVDDTGAVYPVEIDPVYTTAATTLTGEATGNWFGWSVSGAGDVNNDGYDDVIVGACNYSSGTGRAYVYTGSASGVSTTAATTLTGEATGIRFGWSVSDAGDVNNDGYDDVIVGAFKYSYSTGRAYVYTGSASGVSTTAATTLTGEATGNQFGLSVSGAGDVNNDGYDDVIVGALRYSSNIGRTYVYAGSASGVSTTAVTTLTGGGSGYYFGLSVSGAGDVNGDGYDDVIVGAYGYSSDTGRAYVYAGSASGVSSTAATTLTGEATGNQFGWSVSDAGDVNNDGYDDVIVGATGYSSGTGRAYEYAGSASGVSTTAATTLTGEATYSEFGNSVSGAGDVNNDGYDDVIVGARGFSSTGRAYLYAGSASGVSTSAATTLTGEASSYYGHSVSDAGDVNNDGYDDVVVGASYYSYTTGRAYVYLGYSDDADGDGYAVALDCDDTDAAINPGATEVCDASDNDEDCDGHTDDADSSASAATKTSYYLDSDSDGYGGSTTGTYCDLPTGYTATFADCDDSVAAVNPGATEVCDAANTDEDCDGLKDDADSSASAATKSSYYLDSDGDGFGGSTTGAYCDLPTGYTATSTDCDDSVATVNPGATEVCDAADTDEDCDGLADDADSSAAAATMTTWYRDADSDGYAGTATTSTCDMPTGYLSTSTDCDDTQVAVNPGATEICDAANTDEDCDGLSDDADSSASAATKTGYYLDGDGDGYGSTTSAAWCDLPPGYATGSTDCDDFATGVNPGATEVCDAANTDEDCDGLADDADSSVSAATYGVYHADVDGDGWGDLDAPVGACDASLSAVVDDTDCDDLDPDINPDATEVAGDSVDQDCDLSELCYVDADDDGWRTDTEVASTTLDCSGLGEALASDPADDCDDADAAFHPDATEDDCADPNDYNCDGFVGYADADGDGYAACEECDDGLFAVNPSATELCNGIDDNCDSSTDGADAVGATDWYADLDGDLYTDPTDAVASCDPPEGYAAASAEADCDDGDETINPEALEGVDDAVDQDCDGLELCYLDQDDDGYRPDETSTLESADLLCDASGEATAEDPSGDCDDLEATVYPGATEVAGDGVDQDCDSIDLAIDSGEPDSGEPDSGAGSSDPDGDDGESNGGGGKGCGCSAHGGARAGWLGLLLGVAALGARRRRVA
jgi:MYXO-CTERM domain-containing protein